MIKSISLSPIFSNKEDKSGFQDNSASSKKSVSWLDQQSQDLLQASTEIRISSSNNKIGVALRSASGNHLTSVTTKGSICKQINEIKRNLEEGQEKGGIKEKKRHQKVKNGEPPKESSKSNQESRSQGNNHAINNSSGRNNRRDRSSRSSNSPSKAYSRKSQGVQLSSQPSYASQFAEAVEDSKKYQDIKGVDSHANGHSSCKHLQATNKPFAERVQECCGWDYRKISRCGSGGNGRRVRQPNGKIIEYRRSR